MTDATEICRVCGSPTIYGELYRLGFALVEKALGDIEVVIATGAPHASGNNAEIRREWIESHCEEVCKRLRYLVKTREDHYQAMMERRNAEGF